MAGTGTRTADGTTGARASQPVLDVESVLFVHEPWEHPTPEPGRPFEQVITDFEVVGRESTLGERAASA